ncbi:MAG: acetolactate synthase small subunit [Planctomycetota bacterium]
MRHIISCLVRNKPGVLAQIAGLISSRGFNIDSFTGGETERPEYSSLTLVTTGDDRQVAHIVKQLRKLIDTIRVEDITATHPVERDLALIKVSAPPRKRQEIYSMVDVFRGKIVDIGLRNMVIEISGPEAKVDAFLELLTPYGIQETIRTGRIAMVRGRKR